MCLGVLCNSYWKCFCFASWAFQFLAHLHVNAGNHSNFRWFLILSSGALMELNISLTPIVIGHSSAGVGGGVWIWDCLIREREYIAKFPAPLPLLMAYNYTLYCFLYFANSCWLCVPPLIFVYYSMDRTQADLINVCFISIFISLSISIWLYHFYRLWQTSLDWTSYLWKVLSC